MEEFTSQPKRFPLQEDAFAKERIHLTREAILAAKKIYPEILSGTLYGSLAYGKSKEETSDIDCIVFVDPELSQTLKNVEVDPSTGEISFSLNGAQRSLVDIKYEIKPVDRPNEFGYSYRGIHSSYLFYEEQQDMYKQALSKKMLTDLPDLTEKKIFHVSPVPITKEFISGAIHDIYLCHTDQDAFKKELGERLIQERKFTQKENIKYLLELPAQFYQIFQLELGIGLKEYREYLISSLEKLDFVGEIIWRAIVSDLEYYEQKKTGNPQGSVRYPKTLAEAKKIYLER